MSARLSDQPGRAHRPWRVVVRFIDVNGRWRSRTDAYPSSRELAERTMRRCASSWRRAVGETTSLVAVEDARGVIVSARGHWAPVLDRGMGRSPMQASAASVVALVLTKGR